MPKFIMRPSGRDPSPLAAAAALFAVLVSTLWAGPSRAEALRGDADAQGPAAARHARIARAVGEVFAGSETGKNLRALCDDIGGRLSGTEACRRALAFAGDLFREYGLANVHEEPYDFPGWFRGPFSCEVVSPRPMALHAVALGNTPSTPAGGVEAEVVDAAHGNPVELDRLGSSLEGKYALVIDEPMPGGRWMHRSEIMLEVSKRGAAGLLFQTVQPGQLPVTGTCWNSGVSPVPGVGISMEDGEWMRRSLARGEKVVVRVEMTNQTGPASSANLVAEIPGSGPDLVIVGGHIDSWDLAQGAVDNGTGTVVVLEAARALAKAGVKPRATIRFVLFTGEESGLYGSNAYAAAHEAELARCRAMINCDMEGAPVGIRVMGHEEARRFFEELVTSIPGFDLTTPLSFRAGIYGDQQAFLLGGVPVVVPSSRLEESAERYYHTAGDTYDKVDTRSLPACAAFVASIALEIAWPGTRPVEGLDRAGVERLVRDNNLEDALRAWGNWPKGH
jgi:carboxypeptidase Q